MKNLLNYELFCLYEPFQENMRIWAVTHKISVF